MADETESAPAPADESKPLAERVGRIETEQERQGGILAEIRDHLTGTGKPDNTNQVTRADEPAASAADMRQQMIEAVRAVRAEEAAAAKDEPKRPEPETTPREVMIRGKAKLQNVLFGTDTK